MADQPSQLKRLLAQVGPGLLVAATGVGAGDLATGALTGSRLGLTVLWAVVIGAVLKYVMTEGLCRWQLATGTTLLEGVVKHTGRVPGWIFLAYLVVWSYFVGVALMSACGIAAHAIVPFRDADTDKIVYGIIHSAIAVFLVKRGGYRLFEKVMSVCIVVMFITVVAAAIAVKPPIGAVITGLLIPSVPDLSLESVEWTVALMGGVGGTVTVLCYGYWIREEHRESINDLGTCRVDLACGYVMTGLFGIAMVILGSSISVDDAGKGASLIVNLGNELKGQLGTIGTPLRWAFLIGAWGAIFSSLLGVWQSVPYLFSDFRRMTQGGAEGERVDVSSWSYRGYLYAIASIPALGLFVSFSSAQKLYAIFGAFFLPLLALVLLDLNSRTSLVGEQNRNGRMTNGLLTVTLLVFVAVGAFVVRKNLFAG